MAGECKKEKPWFPKASPLYLAGFQYFDCPVCRIGLLIFNWQMGLALLWVAPISFAIVILSRKWQEKLSKKHMNARLELAEGI